MPRQQHYIYLDFCRGVAALIVLLYHLGSTIGGPKYFGSGFLAVDFFFVLSGFIVAYAYEPRLRSGMGMGEFVRSRIIRLYPMAAAGVLIGYGAALLDLHFNPEGAHAGGDLHGALLANLFIAPKIWGFDADAELFPLNGAIWSLFFELMMNLLFALTLPKLSNRVLFVLAALGGAVSLGMALYFGTFNLGWNWQSFVGGFARALFGFSVGVLIFRFKNRLKLGFPGAGLLVLIALVLAPLADEANLYASAFAIFALFPACVILGLNTSWSGLLSLQKLSGNLSYPLYALHLPLLGGAATLYKHYLPSAPAVTIHVLAALGAVFAAFLAFRYLDAPVRRYLNGLVQSGGDQRQLPYRSR